MKKKLLRIGAAGIAVGAVASFGSLSAAHLTGLTLFGVNFASNELVSINPATGAATIVGSFGETTFATGLGVRNDRLFIFDQVDDRIREVNKISGELVSSIDIGVGDLNGEGALAFRPSDGVGFLASPLNADNEPSNDFFMFAIAANGTAGTSVRLGSTGVAIDAMAFNSQGTLYGIGQADGTLYTINTTTGATTALGPVAPLKDATGATVPKNSPIAGMTFGTPNPDMGNVEEIYAAIDDRLYIVTPSTGAARLSPGAPAGQNIALNFGPFVSSVSGLAFSPGAAATGNISTRIAVGTDENVGIGGFIIRGTPSKRVLIRGLGPSITQVPGVLADPVLELFDEQGDSLVQNDDWRDDQESDIEDTGLPPSDDREAAIIRTLEEGEYTAILRGKSRTSGIGLVEIYDLDLSSASRLANLSTRGNVQTGDQVLIGGVIISGSASQRVVFRAIGPTLSSAGIQTPLQDPTLQLHDANGMQIAENDNWRTDQETEIMMDGLAPGDDRESALRRDLPPGEYTAIVRGAADGVGVGLVEVYNLGVPPAP